MMAGIEELLARARELQSKAHAPYSGFRVGSILETQDGVLHGGCNVENASLGLTLCAERGAVAAAIAAGDRTFRRLVLATDGDEAVPPCGACREVLAEFCSDLHIVSVAGESRKEWTLGELLPHPFRLKSPRGLPPNA
ncbi:MAG: cytidine deaminase [Gemmatimonadota bacterium]